MKLYYANGTIAIAAAITLIEAGLDHDLVRLDFADAAQSAPDYLALNPKGRVPALELTDGTVLTETGAILEYIAALAPKAELLPDTAEGSAHMRAVMYYIASTMHVAHAHRMRGHRWADLPASHADMTAKVPQTMRACAEYVENDCLRGDYVCGDRITIADAYLFVACNWLKGDGVDTSDLPRLSSFLDRMAQRDSVKTLRAQGMI